LNQTFYLVAAAAPAATAAGTSTPTAATAASTATASAVAAAPAATATAAAIPAATTAATAAFTGRTSFVDDHVPAHEIVTVKCLNRAARIIVAVHFDEAESAWLTREAVAHQRNVCRRHAHLCEPIAEILFCSLKGKVPHVQFFHERAPWLVAKGLHKHAAEEAGQLRTQSRTIAGYSGAKVALQLSGASSAKRLDHVNVHP
jgi:hypothetical protein